MKLNGEKVLVTGAGGFIGSHLVERLVREGASVRAMVHTIREATGAISVRCRTKLRDKLISPPLILRIHSRFAKQ